MNAAEMRTLRKTVAESWAAPLSDTEFDIWAEHLHRYPFGEVIAAVRKLAATETFRPRVVTVVENLYSGPDPHDLVDKAWRAIGQYGYHSEARAQAELPRPVWDLIESYGGWMKLCMSPDDVGTKERLTRTAETIVRRAARQSLSPVELETPGRAELHAEFDGMLRALTKSVDDL